MQQDKKQAIALMRYSAIAPLISGTNDDFSSLSAYFRQISAKGIVAPDNSVRHYAPSTIERWYLNYKKHGFDALIPVSRSDCGVSRKIDDDLKEQIIYLKHNYRSVLTRSYLDLITPNKFSSCEAEECGIAEAMANDDNKAGGNLGK